MTKRKQIDSHLECTIRNDYLSIMEKGMGFKINDILRNDLWEKIDDVFLDEFYRGIDETIYDQA